MSDFEPISIEIEASAEKANRGLQELDSSLQSIQTRIQGISQLLNGLSGKGSSVASSIKSLANAINGINTNNVKNVSTAIDNIGTSAENSATKTKKSIEGIDENLNAISRAMRDAFKIKSTEGIDALSEAVRKLYEAKERAAFANTNGDQLGFEMATQEAERLREKIIEIAQEFGRYSSKGIEENKKLWDNIKSYAERGEKIYIDPELRGDILDDDFKALNSKLNNVFSKVEPPAWLSNPTFFKDWRDRMQTELSGIDLFKSPKGSGENPLKTIAEYAEEGKRANMSLGDAIKGNKKDIQELEEFANQAYETLGKLADTVANKFMSDSMEQYAESVREAQQGTSELSTEVSKLGDSAPKIEEMASAFGKVGEELQSSLSEGINENAFANQMQNIQNVMTSGFTRTVQAIKSSLKEIKLPPIDTSNADKAGQEVKEKINSAVRSEKWSDVFSEIERMNQDYEQLTHTMGEANAEMQILVDTRNRLKQAFSATESGKMLWDTESMTKANAMLKDAEDKIERVKRSIKEPNRLELEVDPTGELEQLYSRLREVQSLISDMRNNKINFTTTDMTSALKEQETITKRIAELEGRSTKKDNNSLEWMAQIMALQNQLEKMSGTFNRWGEIAKKAFLKALTPLKLFKHEFEEIKGLITAVSRIGSAFAMISKPITKVFKNFQKTAQQAFSKIQKAWAKVMRTFTFMLIRKAITAVITNINNAITSLAKFSKTTDGKFNDTMSLLTSDFRYLGASLTAAFSPILNYVVPILDRFVDVLVGVINKVNMFFAVLTKSKTYTIAKKKIVDYTDAMEDANKKAKQLTLGIDELNILSEDTSSKKDEEDMFDWVTLPTPTIDIPDWLKWLKDLWSKLWDAIKQMLKALWDALKEAWNRAGEALKNAIKHFLESLVGLITDIIRDLTKLFQTEKFKEFLAKLLRIIAKIIEFISIIIDKIREAWNYNNLGYQILEAILDILDTIATHIENILDMMIEWAHSLTFVPLFEAVLAVLKQINYAIDQIGYVAEDVAKIVLGILKLVIEDYAPRLLRVIGDIIEGIGNIAKQLHEAIEETNFTDKFVSAFDGLMQAIIPHLEEVGEYFKLWASQLDFTPLLESIIKLFESLEPVADFVGGVFSDFVEHYILPVAKHLVEKVIPKIADAISNFADKVDWGKLRQNIDKIIKSFEHLTGAIGDGVAKAMSYLGEALAKFINSQQFTNFIDTLTGFINKVDGDMVAKILSAIGIAILKIAEAVVKFVNSEGFKAFLDALIRFVKEKSVNEIADILLNIAGAFVAFKGLSFLAKAATIVLNFIGILGKAIEGLGTIKGLFTAVETAGGVAGGGISASFAPIAGIILAIVTAVYSMVASFGNVGALLEEIGGHVSKVTGNLIKMLEKIGLIDRLKKAFTEVKKSVKELLGSLGDLKAVWQILFTWWEKLATVGTVLLIPMVNGAVTAFQIFTKNLKFVINIIKSVIEIVGGLGEIIHGVFTGDMEEAANGFKRIWEGVKSFFGSFKDYLIGIVKTLVEAIVSLFKWLKWMLIGDPIVIDMWNGIVEVFSNAIDKVVEFVRNLVEQVVEFFQNLWDKAVEIWNAIVDTIVSVWNGLLEKLAEVWDAINTWFSDTWTAFSTWCSETWNAIVQGIIDLWTGFTERIAEVWDAINEWFMTTWETFKEWVGEIWASIVQTIIDTWNGFVESMIEVWETIQEWFATTWEEFKEWVGEVWNEIVKTIVDIWNGLIESIQEAWTNFADWISTAWESFKDWATTLWGEIRDFIIDCWDKVKEYTIETWDKILSKIQEVWNWLKNNVGIFFNFIKQTIIDAWEIIHNKTSEIWSAIQEFLSGVWEFLKTTAEEVFGGIRDFLLSVWNNIQQTWEDVWNGIKNAVVDIWNAIKSEAEIIIGALRSWLETVWDGLETFWSNAWNEISNAVKTSWDDLAETADRKFGEIKEKVAQKWEEIKTEAGNKWDAIKSFLSTKWSNLKSEAKRVFDDLAKTIADVWKKIKETVSDTWDGVKSFIDGIGDSIVDLGKKVGDAISKLKELGKEKDNVISEKSGKPFWQVDGFAEGGFPEKGSLFVAGEKGAELVGEINGKTAVANEQEITKAISDAVSEAMVDIAEKIETAMDKMLIAFESVVDQMLDEFGEYLGKMLSRINYLIVEVADTRVTIKDTAKAELDIIKTIASKLVAVFDAARYDIVSSNRTLEDSYRNDDSAVSSSFSRMSQSYEFSNDTLIGAIDTLAGIIQKDDETMFRGIKELLTSIISGMGNIIAAVKSISSTVNSALAKGDLGSSVDDVGKGADEVTLADVYNGMNTLYQGLGKALVTTAEMQKDYFLEALKLMRNITSGVDYSTKSIISQIQGVKRAIGDGFGIPTYATGGMPEDGWFRASHGEIMGQFDNGKSVVANNNQIVDGIASGVSQANSNVVDMLREVIRAIEDKNTTLNIDSREIAKANSKGQSKLGHSLVTFT